MFMFFFLSCFLPDSPGDTVADTPKHYAGVHAMKSNVFYQKIPKQSRGKAHFLKKY